VSSCRDVRTALRASRLIEGRLEAHLFACRRCRSRAHAQRLYRALPVWFARRLDSEDPRDLESFVAGVMRRVRARRGAGFSRRRLAVGALVLFFLTCAGGFLSRSAGSNESPETASASAIGTLTGDVTDSFWDGVLGWGA
jgi:hypothetical protein